MDFKIRRENNSTYDLGFSTKPMENLMNIIASHRLSNLFFGKDIPKGTEIYIRRMGKKEFWLISNNVWVSLNPKHGDVKITFHPDVYRYEISVKWEDFNPAEVIDKFADAVDCVEQIVTDFTCRFYDACNLKKNKEQFSFEFDIEFDITNLDKIRCDIENGCAMAGASFECSLDDLKTKNAQEVFDSISYVYEDDEL